MRTHRRGPLAALMATVVIALPACDGLMEVELPGNVEAAALNNPAMARTLVNSALGQFECAYTSYVATAGILSNEYINASSWLNINTWGWRGLELHSIAGDCPAGRDATGLGAYTPLQQARYMAEESARLIEGFPDDKVQGKSEMLAQLSAYGGYAILLLGEGYCEMAIDQGPLMTREQVFKLAEQRFSTAITHAEAANRADLKNLALAGRARARLNLKDMNGAATDASLIPTGFVYNAEYSTVNGIRENRVFNLNRRNRYLSVNPVSYSNLRVGTAPDPRVPVRNSGLKGHDGATEHWNQEKYNSAAAPIPMASWREAQLIIAEARPSETVAAINRLRASQNIAPLQLSGGEDMLALVIEERRRQLFSEGHRLNDMLRHNIAFPTGVNHKGQAWGPVTCMPLPEQEKLNNPSIKR